jgi:O-methyltransferase
MNKISELKLRLRQETAQTWPEWTIMLTAPDQAEHMKFLVEQSKVKRGIEVGTFTGYSALSIAEGLPSDGKLICLDISEEYTNVAKKYWKEAGVDEKIELVLGPGKDYLDKLLEDEANHNAFDFAFVDADKPNYPVYYEQLVKLVRPGGWILLDNALWGGCVAYPE